MAPFKGWGSAVSRLQNDFKEIVHNLCIMLKKIQKNSTAQGFDRQSK